METKQPEAERPLPCGGAVCPYCEELIEGGPATSVAICCDEVGHAWECGDEGRLCVECQERAEAHWQELAP